MTYRFLCVDDPLWLDTLAICPHDVYHLPAYAALEADWIGATPLAFRYFEGDAAMLIVLLERPTPSGRARDTVSPYGYACPVFTPGVDAAFHARALAAFQHAARARGLVTSFMRLHPLLLSALGAASDLAGGAWREEERGVTLTMPMVGGEACFLTGLARGHRAGVRRLREAGGRLVLDTPDVWAAFPEIYRKTMEKVGAGDSYFYSDDYIARFRAELAAHVHCAGIAAADGTIMCAGLFTQVGDILQYHLSGTAEGFARQAPMKLLLVAMRAWAATNGIAHFHLGGGLGAKRDSLYAFKQQFGGTEWPFRTVSVIHDIEAYAAECARRSEEARSALLPQSDFFPLYRAPLPETAEA